MTKNYRGCIKKAKDWLMDAPVNFFSFSNQTYRSLFTSGDNENLLSSSGYDKEYVMKKVKDYHALWWWEKIWWHLTMPMTEYIMINDVLALIDMDKEEDISKGIEIYNNSTLINRPGLWDWLTGSPRYYLDEAIKKIINKKEENKEGEKFDTVTNDINDDNPSKKYDHHPVSQSDKDIHELNNGIDNLDQRIDKLNEEVIKQKENVRKDREEYKKEREEYKKEIKKDREEYNKEIKKDREEYKKEIKQYNKEIKKDIEEVKAGVTALVAMSIDYQQHDDNQNNNRFTM